MSDLFASTHPSTSRPIAAPSAAHMRLELDGEAVRYRLERRIDDGNRLVHADLVEIRRRVSARLGIALGPIERRASDSWAGGHDRDSLWPALLDRAWRLVWIAYNGKPACCGVDSFAAHGAVGVDLLDRAERDAAAELREMASFA